MANGDVIFSSTAQRLIHLLDAQTVAGLMDGVWAEVGNYYGGFLGVSGMGAGDKIWFRGSNAAAKPANTAHGFSLNAEITTDGTVSTAVLPIWVKTQVTAFAGGGTITAALLVRAKG